MKPLYLASKSPRRAKILESLGLKFEVAATSAPEVTYGDDPERTVRENAAAKLAEGMRAHPGSRVLAADTIVWYSGRIYGKPRTFEEAAEFLRELGGRTHTVFTGVAYFDGTQTRSAVARSDVKMRSLSEGDIASYIEKVKPLDRAGAYDIDECGDMVVEGYSGSYENIMGLPDDVVAGWLGEGK